ncbi:hypothetical protein COV93_06270 [Candidatus Woesearchaeota archaeon CG11_big_fil_rev_8_21_14_0_20_43_8]|nr:MAG: hypothetical protein COV93_06270 [Candidatus Woesearchaeota archaeon CG11_big_fil_rev_8_21_14_0_20_43_8]PIO08516.1 MAG: hypothetical protein COT47_01240 [Candidatus Woesearchaeota archaeon CG08_land_8_20_14_0_20_43_7]
MKKLNKKGQFYIFLCLVLLAYIATLSPSLDISQGKATSYSIARDNYLTECTHVINNALFEKQNVTSQLDYFTQVYIDYQEVQGLSVSVIYLLSMDDTLYVRNYYKDSVIITPSGETAIGKDTMHEFQRMSQVAINASKYEYYTFNIDVSKQIDLQVIFKTETSQ